jgi:hypothetical protein
MAMMLPMRIVISQNPALVGRGHKVINEGKIVSDNLACPILPSLFTNESGAGLAMYQRFLINCLRNLLFDGTTKGYHR